MHAVLVLNENAGTVAQSADVDRATVARELAGAGFELASLPDHAPGLPGALEAAVSMRPEVIFVGGGDGTISTAAGVLAGRDVALAPLPLGTLNHFARDLGEPADWREAIRSLAAGTLRPVDVAEVNGRAFINNCSLGSYAEAVRRRDALRREKNHGKWAAMFIACVTVWRERRRMRLRVEMPERTLRLHAPFVLISNNRYAGHVLDSSLRPRLDEGQLWFYATRAHRARDLLPLIWQALTRPLESADALETYPATEFTIRSERGAVPVAADGELINVNPPFRFRVRPGALRVLAPRPTTT